MFCSGLLTYFTADEQIVVQVIVDPSEAEGEIYSDEEDSRTEATVKETILSLSDAYAGMRTMP